MKTTEGLEPWPWPRSDVEMVGFGGSWLDYGEVSYVSGLWGADVLEGALAWAGTLGGAAGSGEVGEVGEVGEAREVASNCELSQPAPARVQTDVMTVTRRMLS